MGSRESSRRWNVRRSWPIDPAQAENAVTEGDVSINPIELTIYSPNVHDCILVDLPGFVIAPEMHQADDLPEQIQVYPANERVNETTDKVSRIHSHAACPVLHRK